MFISLNLQATTLSIVPQEAFVLNVERSFLTPQMPENYVLFAKSNTMFRVLVDNTTSTNDLNISELKLTINNNGAIWTKDFSDYKFHILINNKADLEINYNPLIVKAGTKNFLGGNESYFIVDNLIDGDKRDFYDFFKSGLPGEVTLIGFYIDKSGLPIRNFMGTANLTLLSF